MTDKADYPQAAFGGDTIHSVTLTPQEHAAYTSGWNRAIEAAERDVMEWESFEFVATPRKVADDILALSMPAPAQAWRVKPLEWKDGTTYDDEEGPIYSEAVGAGYTYCAEALDCTLDEAKSAAQADYAARILAAIEVTPEPQVQGWQDISTAPKDGTSIIVAARGGVSGILLVWWDSEWDDEGWWMCDDGKRAYELPLRGPYPTHWMPLPSAPEVTP